ncbi:MAG: arylsulfatase A-like enzyme [Verrucomicrobiales bacterium]|jgi:arylsulfatase A-like enzyme
MLFLKRISLVVVFAAIGLGLTLPATAEKPNLIFIMADDLGYGDLGCFGSTKIKTPNLDRMAAEGMKLTDFYAGSTVCAPSRCVLMTGLHTGHCWVRGNANSAPKQTLQPDHVTVAAKMKEAGYATALCGKWGLGELESTGHPNLHGFDYFYGYLNQRHAHNFYPEFLIEDREVVKLRNKSAPEWVALRKERGFADDGAGWASPEHKLDYSHDLIVEKAFTWLEENKDGPFFLYLPFTIPHANNEATKGTGNGQEVPDHGIYADKDWPDPDKGQAAMVSRMDGDIGRIFAWLKANGLDENTLVMFTSDNGHHKEGGNDPEFFDANGPLQGMKRAMHEGGIRVPTIARWPGKIAAGSDSNHPAYFGDLMASACELAGVKPPTNADSISFLPALTGEGEQKTHDYLYWEFYEQGGKQAVRFGDWKAIRRPMLTGEIQLYNLAEDIGEEKNLASQFPEKVQQAAKMMDEAHVDDPNWPLPKPKGKKKR